MNKITAAFLSIVLMLAGGGAFAQDGMGIDPAKTVGAGSETDSPFPKDNSGD